MLMNALASNSHSMLALALFSNSLLNRSMDMPKKSNEDGTPFPNRWILGIVLLNV
jgi:hypothetical protein